MIYDISLTISDDMVTWPKDPKVVINKARSISNGDSCNVTQLEMGSHTGTHIDAPYHFDDEGKKVDQLDLKTLTGGVTVFSISNNKEISIKDVKALPLDGETRVLFKTSNSAKWQSGMTQFIEDYVYVTNEAAKYLVDTGIKLVGIDYLSIEKYGSKGHETHKTFLENSVILVEGLNLSSVSPGNYELIALPLKIKDGDGSPARVILTQFNK